MVKPKVSIVLPTYNGSRFIEESIESCLQQTLTDWELVVVDDGSTDDTSAIVQKYVDADSRIRLIQNRQNLKLPKSLNVGFVDAKGEYFTWISDDNLFRPDALQKMSDFLDVNADVDFVYSDYSLIDETGAVIKSCQVSEPYNLIVVNSVGSSFLYRRQVHETLGGYDEDLFMLEDYDFWLRAACQHKLVTFHEDLYLYRTHGNTLSSQHGSQIHSAHWKYVERQLPKLGRFFPPYQCARSYIYLAYFALLDGKKKEFFKHLKNAWSASPSGAVLPGARFTMHQIRRQAKIQ